ncbi:MAG: beta-lactamase family protein [Lachnospiraceae bacterium]|nr:beta-lactamase family protein [Lachnospiraceae bacterium]
MNQNILKRLDDFISSKLWTNYGGSDSVAGAAVCVIHKGKEVYRREYGDADKERGIPMAPDSIFRCYSMTKPVTAAAVMTLVEKGLISLIDPVSMYLPGFRRQQVLTLRGLVPVQREVTIQNLLDMTSGIAYPDIAYPAGGIMQNLMDEYYRKLYEEDIPTSTYALANLIGQQPLAFQPGEGWCYGFSADILGAVIEVVTEETFGEYLKETIFNPLGMVDTDFYVPEEKQNRLCQYYEYIPETRTLKPCTWQHLGLAYMHLKKPFFESGGAGLVSTIDDYAKFALMLLGQGTYQGVRILGRKTVEYMVRNHLNEKQLKYMDWEEQQGYGYGNLMRVMTDLGAAGQLGSEGEFGWDGWLGSYVSIDPKEELVILYVVQKCEGGGHRNLQAVRNIIYAALEKE